MSLKIRRLSSAFRYCLSPRDIWSDVRFYWFSGDRGNAMFGAGFVLLFLLLGVFIYRTIISQYDAKELQCLTLNVYHEARGEPEQGKYAVASVTLNRVASRHYPDTVCEVVFQKRWDRLRKRYVSAFSWTELESPISMNSKSWKQAARIAEEVYRNPESQILKGALFYHASHIRPSWARKKVRVAKIGRHVFYN